MLSYQVKSHGATLESQLAAGYNSMADSLGGMIKNSGSDSSSSPGQDLTKYKNMETFLSNTLSQNKEGNIGQTEITGLDLLESEPATQHRYQNSHSAGFHSQTVDVRPYGIALYNFVPQYENELSLKSGEMIFLLQHVDSDWMEGELDNQRGIFPRSYVNIVVDCPSPSPSPRPQLELLVGREYRVLFSFTGERPGDISLEAERLVTILSQSGADWCLVRSEESGQASTGLCPVNHLNTCPEPLNLPLSLSSSDREGGGHSLKFFDPLCTSPDEEMIRVESELIKRAADRPRVPINHEVRLHTNLNLSLIQDQRRPRHRFKSSLASGREEKPNIDSFISQNLDGLKEIKAPLFLPTTANFVPSSSSSIKTTTATSATSDLQSVGAKKSFTISDSVREELMGIQKKSAAAARKVSMEDKEKELQDQTNNEAIYLPMSSDFTQDISEDKRKSLRVTVSSSTLCSSDSVYATVKKKKSKKEGEDEIFYHSVDVTSSQSPRSDVPPPLPPWPLSTGSRNHNSAQVRHHDKCRRGYSNTAGSVSV